MVKPFLEKFTAEYYKIRDLLVKYETDINAQVSLIFVVKTLNFYKTSALRFQRNKLKQVKKYKTDVSCLQTELIFENLRKMFAMLPANFKTEKMLNDIATAYWNVAQAKFPKFDKAIHEKIGQIFVREVLEFSSNANTDTDTKTKPTDEL